MALPLTIREDQREIYVQGLSEYNVKGVADTLALLRLADNNRAIRDTAMNMLSSRSHSIFQVDNIKYSCLYICIYCTVYACVDIYFIYLKKLILIFF